MADPKGEGVKVGFDGSIRLEFHGAKALLSKLAIREVGSTS